MYEKYIDLTKAIEYASNTVFDEIFYFEDENADGVINLSGDNSEVKKKFNLNESLPIHDITKAILDKGKTVFCLMGTINTDDGFSIDSPTLTKSYEIAPDETLLKPGGFGVYVKEHDGKYVCQYGLYIASHLKATFKHITHDYEEDIIGKDVIESLNSLDMYYSWDIVPTVEEAEIIIKKTKHAKINLDKTIRATRRSAWMDSDYFLLLANGIYFFELESGDEEDIIENNLEEGIYIALALAHPDDTIASDIEGENTTDVVTWKDSKEYCLPEDCQLGYMQDDYGILVSKKDDEFEITFSINESFRYGPGLGYQKISSIEDKLEEPLHRALIKIMYDAIIFEDGSVDIMDIIGKILSKLDGNNKESHEKILKEVLDEELKGKSDIEYNMIISSLLEAMNELKTRLDNIKSNSQQKDD